MYGKLAQSLKTVVEFMVWVVVEPETVVEFMIWVVTESYRLW